MRTRHAFQIRAVHVFLAAFALPVFAGFAVSPAGASAKDRFRKLEPEAQRSRLNACARKLSEGLPLKPGECQMPTGDVFVLMGKEEKKCVALGLNNIYERLMGTNRCPEIEIKWGEKALSLLRASDSPEAEGIIRRVRDTPVKAISSLSKLNQAERLMRSAYAAPVPWEAEPAGGFEQSRVKKDIVRRQLFLMRRGK